MLYHIVIITILSVFAYAVVVLIRKIAIIQRRRKERQFKELEFMNNIVSKGDLKPGQLPGLYDFVDTRTTNNQLGGNQTRALIFQEINRMSDEELRQFYQEFQKRQNGKPRKHDRKDLLLVVDYTVGDKYHRDVIQDISESGVFIKTSQAFSVGQKIRMAFMSPDHQKPFKIKGEIVRTHTDGVGVKFIMESQVQEAALKNFMSNIQKETVGTQ